MSISQLKERKRIALDNFLGVDFSSSPLKAAAYRATDAANFINEDGVNRKRKGWHEQVNFGMQINGVWQLGGFTVVHAGTKFYKLLSDNSYTEIAVSSNSIRNERSYGVVYGNKLWLLCGDYLVYGERDGAWIMERVEDSADVTIPRTTISIDCDAVTYDRHRQTIDDVNFLTPKRKNGFVSYNRKSVAVEGGGEDETELEQWTEAMRTYTVDSKKIDAGEVILSVNFLIDDALETREYRNENGGAELVDEYNTVIADIDFEKGKFTLAETFAETLTSYNGMDNMTLTFSVKTDGYADNINKCKIGALFGVGGNDNRLFIAGNPDNPNICYHSEEGDFTYFGDMNTAACGSNSIPIMAFSRIGDGTLAVHKKSNRQEASVYYRTSQMQDIYVNDFDDNGNYIGQKVNGQRGIFPIKAGAMGEGAITSYANANLSGDSLFVSENGVYGITLANNVATDERFAKARSELINGRLTHNDLDEAVGIVYKNRYYLCMDNVCYVADARFKTSPQNDIGAFNYEWWYWTNIPARVFAVINDKLCFGTDDGRLCLFEDNYIDVHYESIATGDIGVIPSESRFVLNTSLKELLETGDNIVFNSGQYAGELLYIDDIVTDENGTTTFRVKQYGEVLALDESMTGLTGKFRYNNNVSAHWATPIMDLKTNEYAKTLLGLTLACEPTTNGELVFGYQTRDLERYIQAQGVKLWSWADLDFATLDFSSITTTTFASSYSVRVRQRNFNFIMFRWYSNNDKDCAVNSLNIVYKINRVNRGVR